MTLLQRGQACSIAHSPEAVGADQGGCRHASLSSKLAASSGPFSNRAENLLVARTSESRWEAKLTALMNLQRV
ncbi:hypothetical protein [Micromonospora sp. HUAS LYJ1]|uniref:hypothetical protein n=1 Tax=Micromonospora sp. HUAS LYJ1 TaxID=3061626 RepID=UPI002671D8F1|nr:hypothetical protein [Micromonospora sp. HUAS LYJ1]WKU04484.1 hypothetical protein Q2K16_27360 [Micromonospora sp. HUAS LYJ1]